MEGCGVGTPSYWNKSDLTDREISAELGMQNRESKQRIHPITIETKSFFVVATLQWLAWQSHFFTENLQIITFTARKLTKPFCLFFRHFLAVLDMHLQLSGCLACLRRRKLQICHYILQYLKLSILLFCCVWEVGSFLVWLMWSKLILYGSSIYHTIYMLFRLKLFARTLGELWVNDLRYLHKPNPNPKSNHRTIFDWLKSCSCQKLVLLA